MEIRLYESERGRRPVRHFIERLDTQTQAKVARALLLLRRYGSELGMPHSKQLRSNLYELRVRGKIEVRVFYCFTPQGACLLHAFQKKSGRTPMQELENAILRQKILGLRD